MGMLAAWEGAPSHFYNFPIFISFASESTVARNTILLQRDVLWTSKI